jgi:hypothetical protein
MRMVLRNLCAFLIVLNIMLPSIAGAQLPKSIIVDPHNPAWFVYNRDVNRDGELDPFYMCGPGDPEGFLYRGVRKPDGIRDGDQEALIDKMAQYGGNCVYVMAVRTHGGDAWKDLRDDPAVYPDDLHNPWIEQDPGRGLNTNILDQWDEWFTRLDENGITTVFFIYDDAIKIAKQFGWDLDASGNLHPGEKAFIQSLVNRFKHHKHLIWCVMEEGQELGPDWRNHVSKIAVAIRETDEYSHPIATHQLRGNLFFHADDPVIDQFAIQSDHTKVETLADFRNWMLTCWENAGGRYNLNMAECFSHRDLMEKGEYSMVRKYNWTAAMSGAYVMAIGMDIANTPPSVLQDCRRLQQFFESTDFNRMSPEPKLALTPNEFILAQPGRSYIVYSPSAGERFGMQSLAKGRYRLRWLDCVRGVEVVTENVQVAGGQVKWAVPAQFGEEVVLYIQRLDVPAVSHTIPQQPVNAPSSGAAKSQVNLPAVAHDSEVDIIAGEETYVQLHFVDDDGGPGPYTFTISVDPKHGKIRGVGNDLFYTPNPNYVGQDEIVWKVNDGQDDSNTARLVLKVSQ